METNEYRNMRACEDSHWWYHGLRNLWKQALQRYLPAAEELKVADIGCGTGANAAFAAKELPAQVSAADKSFLAVQLARQAFPQGSFIQARAEELPFENASFDAALCMDVLYIEGIDETAALREIFRILKPASLLLINLPAFECIRGRHDRAVHTRRRYTKNEVKEILEGAGFEIVKISYWNFFLFPAVYAARRLSLENGDTRSDVAPVFPPLNFLLKGVLWVERFFFFKTGLPWGVSVFVAARKPA